ncbi:MAG: VgrG-related protein [Nitriliruptorales bacterium]|nr:VgrG-related protein [Nitriliruptorales bacterium]
MVAFDAHAPTPSVSIGGPLSPLLSEKLHRIVVEAQRDAPAMCEIEFWDDDLRAVDDPTLLPGLPLTVESAPASEDPTHRSLGPLFEGEIVAVEPRYTPEGTRVVVRGYDACHRLHRSRKTRTFLMQPDNVIVSQIASEYGLAPRVDPTPGMSEYLCQANQTDWEFLCERAREIGFEVSVSQSQLVFRKAGADPLAGIPQQLELGENLLSFRARATAAEQPTTTKLQSWNAIQKIPVMGLAPVPVSENTPGDPTLLPQTIALQFGTTDDVETDEALDLQPSAMQRAQARRDHLAGVAFEAEGTCLGNPAMVPGGQISLQGTGMRWSGTYTLSSVRHAFDGDGFLTHFTVNGRHDRSLLGLTNPGAARRADPGDAADLGSPVVAKVTNTQDPLQLGRVKAEFPWLGDMAESNWAPVVAMGAGSGKGWQITPEVGDQVLVTFEHGDVRRPYVLGGIHNAQDLQPEPLGAVAGGQTNLRVFKTRAGHVMTFDDTPGMEAVSIETHQGSKIVVQEGPTNEIVISDASGQNEIKIDGASSAISIKSGANLTIESVANLDLKATGQVKIEGQGGVEIKSAAMLNVEGSTTSLKSNGPMTVQGTPIKLN